MRDQFGNASDDYLDLPTRAGLKDIMDDMFEGPRYLHEEMDD
jgi:hypothetical protein